MNKGFVRSCCAGLALFLSACHSPSADIHRAEFSADKWRYATDPHGSKAILDGPLVRQNGVKIAFERVPRVDKNNNSWVELIYDIPSGVFNHSNRITLNYKADKPMLIKLSQSDYGAEGDKSYAHYQVRLAAAPQGRVATVALNEFTRPSWTPSWSKDVGINKANVAALYFVPDLTDAAGGKASIEITTLTLF